MSLKIALAAATELELQPVLDLLGLPDSCSTTWCALNGRSFKAIVIGVGIPMTSYSLGRFLAIDQPDLLIHIGIAGSRYVNRFPIGTCCRVIEDRFADIGAETSEGKFLDMFDLQLWSTDKSPWSGKALRPLQNILSDSTVPTARAITVNLIPGTGKSIRQMEGRYDFDIETMEGAAVFHAAMEAKVPVVCFRGISNVIEPRNRAMWDIAGALTSVSNTVAMLIRTLDDRPLHEQVLS